MSAWPLASIFTGNPRSRAPFTLGASIGGILNIAPGGCDQDGEDHPRLPTADIDGRAIVRDHLEPTEDPEAHGAKDYP